MRFIRDRAEFDDKRQKPRFFFLSKLAAYGDVAGTKSTPALTSLFASRIGRDARKGVPGPVSPDKFTPKTHRGRFTKSHLTVGAWRTGCAHETVLDVALCLLSKHLSIAHRCFSLSDSRSVSVVLSSSISLNVISLTLAEIYVYLALLIGIYNIFRIRRSEELHYLLSAHEYSHAD